MELTKEQCEDLAAKIDSEGFDYYFTNYGADRIIEDFAGQEIDAYVMARKELASALIRAGIEIEL
jgi:hypothetical protein